MASVKVWQNHDDKVLSLLCKMMVNRNLYKIDLQNKKFEKAEVEEVKTKIQKKLKLTEDEVQYFVFQDSIVNNAYNAKKDKINILLKNNRVSDIAQAADTLSITAISRPVKKWFLCFPKV